MAKKHKDLLNEDQRRTLETLHGFQISAEFAVVIIGVMVATINIASVWQIYGVIDIVFLALAVLVLFVSGIVLSFNSLWIKRFGGKPAERSKGLHTWIVLAWCWVLVLIAVLVVQGTVAKDIPDFMKLFFIITIIGAFFANIIIVLVLAQSLWRRFTHRKVSPVRPILYGTLVLLLLIVAIFGTYTTTETIEAKDTTISDGNMELGQSEVRQEGRDGQKLTTHNLIFGFSTATSQSEAVDKITAKGTKRYQYMYCSNGSYRYYEADVFANPSVGFTHQSPDSCAENGQGNYTTLADVPPAKTQTTYVPRSSTMTNCYSSFSGYSFSCYSY